MSAQAGGWPPFDDADPDWKRLAEEVKKRRVEQRQPVDLSSFGGPSEMTVRKIESGEPVSIRPQSRVRLEYALGWRDGVVDRILDGTVTEEDLRPQSSDGFAGLADRLGLSGWIQHVLDQLVELRQIDGTEHTAVPVAELERLQAMEQRANALLSTLNRTASAHSVARHILGETS